jgi:NCS1 family nucleobase:cation symporter-1
MIVDYYFIRNQTLLVNDLYNNKGIYHFRNGFNYAAVIALLIGIAPNVPGFLATIKLMSTDTVPAWIVHLYNYAWFVGFGVSGIVYGVMMKKNYFFSRKGAK